MSLLKAIHAGQITDKFSTEIEKLGTLRITDDGKIYRFVKVVNAIDLVVGSLLQLIDDTTTWEVTADLTGGADGEATAHVVGVSPVINDVSAGEIYQWIQCSGLALVKTNADDDISAADYLVYDVNNQGTCDTMADGEEEQVFAYAVSDDVNADDTVWAMLHNCM